MMLSNGSRKIVISLVPEFDSKLREAEVDLHTPQISKSQVSGKASAFISKLNWPS